MPLAIERVIPLGSTITMVVRSTETRAPEERTGKVTGWQKGPDHVWPDFGIISCRVCKTYPGAWYVYYEGLNGSKGGVHFYGEQDPRPNWFARIVKVVPETSSIVG